MKKYSSFITAPSSLFYLLLSLSFCSCISIRQFPEDTYLAREKDKKSFVQTTDGTVVEGKEAVMRTPLFGKAVIELDRETKIPLKEVQAYQNSQAYYYRVEGQLAPRVKKGLINVYRTAQTTQTYNPGSPGAPGMSNMGSGWQSSTRLIYHLQKGANGEVERLTPKTVNTYVQDYQPALDFSNLYQSNARKYRTWTWINTAAILGGLAITATSGINDNGQVTTAGYAGTGLLFGGIINGFVNRVRKAKNAKNLDLAIDEYNLQAIRNKRK